MQLLTSGVCNITEIPDNRWGKARFWHPVPSTPGKTYSYAAGVLDNIYKFDPALFGLSRREAMTMDPQQRLLLQLTWRAFEDANIDPATLIGARVGVYVGASSLDHANLVSEDPASGGPHFMTGNTLSIVSNRISHIFGLSGPSMTIDTACSSSLVAMHQAVEAIRSGDIDTAIVGGINVLDHPLPFVGFAQARMLSPEGLCRAYDNHGEGYVRAEGGAVLILRSETAAANAGDRSFATVVATGVNSAGRTNGIALPSREAQADLLRSIYDGNAIDPAQLAFVEGHGTGTKVGDPAEIWAIGTVLAAGRDTPLPVGSVKSNIGHLEPASGLFGVLKAMLSLDNDLFPATLHVDELNDDIDFDALNVNVQSTPLALQPSEHIRYAAINSFGFGGANAHVVIADAPEAADCPVPDQPSQPVFIASAHTGDSLHGLLESYRTLLAERPDEAHSIIAASGANRPLLAHRFVVAGEASDVIDSIDSHLSGTGPGLAEFGEIPTVKGKLAFVFSGNGAQWAGMGIEAYRHNDSFRNVFDKIDAVFRNHVGFSLAERLHDPALETVITDTEVAQPLLFAIQVALSDTLIAGGLRPDIAFGHSIGEIAAAYTSGALTLPEAVEIVAKRSAHQSRLKGIGTMAAVLLSAEQAAAFATDNGLDQVSVAAINSAGSVTISGPVEDIKTYRALARKAKIAVQPLDINYPFHHPAIDREREAFLADIGHFQPQAGTGMFVSTVTGGPLSGSQLNADYWWRNVRDPVQFLGATLAALDAGCTVFVEISPKPVLSSYLRDSAKTAGVAANIVSTLSRTDASGDPVRRALARAVAHGAGHDPRTLFGARNAYVCLPPVPFDAVELHPTITSDRMDVFGRNAEHPYTLAGWRTDPQSGNWKNHVDAHLFPDLAEHVVDGISILPGSGFIDIAVSAAQHFFGVTEIEVSNLEILRSLELSTQTMMEVSTVISPETGDIEIRSRERLSDDDWALHAAGRVRKRTDARFETVPATMTGNDVEEVEADAAYETARRFGLDYGPRFRLLSRARFHTGGFQAGEFESGRVVEVDLLPPGANGHPMVTYGLHPISVDAAFHGLVALFGQIAGEQDGAPYIPVRFGAVRIAGTGTTPIVRALIEIERVSASSVKANLTFIDADGQLRATLTDCRFRRTFLTQKKTLADLSVHYEGIASTLSLAPRPREGVPHSLRKLLTLPQPVQSDDATLFADAAILRGAHDLAQRMAGPDEKIDAHLSHEDFALRCFLTHCLYLLEDAGLATNSDGLWTLAPDSDLPTVAQALIELRNVAPERTVEAVLINNAYRDAVERLISGLAGEVADSTSAASVSHQTAHSPMAGQCVNLVEQGLKTLLTARETPVGSVLELGSVSASATRRFANLVRSHDARLLVLEPREAARRELELAFENDPHVFVLSQDDLETCGPVDALISASSALFANLIENLAVRKFVTDNRPCLRTVIAALTAPGRFSDFAFGLRDGWFSRSQLSEFPIGQLATHAQWQEGLSGLGLTDFTVDEVETACGRIIALEMRSKSALLTAVETHRDTVHVISNGNMLLPQADDIVPVSLPEATDFEGMKSAFAALLTEPTQTLRLVYLPSQTEDVQDPSLALQNHVQIFSALAEALRETALEAKLPPVQLAALLAGGAPLASTQTPSATHSGLWTFLRVLQNEVDGLTVTSIDANVDDVPNAIDIARTVLSSDTQNREWVFDADTGAGREVRAVSGSASGQATTTSEFAAATIAQTASAQVSSIVWQACALPVAGANEVAIKVAATGLNFRDVMWAMGLLPEEALEDGFAGATIGMEFSGVVSGVGSAVQDLKIGDRVMAIGASAFSTHAVVNRAGVVKLDDAVDTVAAASLPVAFLTAYYALVELGRISPGNTVLIHGAAGGVGLAALQVAKHKGATVIATAGSPEKRHFLDMLGADHVFNSRSLSFVQDVKAVTGGAGVDLVLNSLFGEAMEQSLSLVKPFGRFLELGKRDFYADSKIGLRPFRRNISYFGIDADQLMVCEPELTRQLFADIGALFAQGAYHPLPTRAFAHDEIADAFRLMQNAGHIGKIVVLPPVAGKDRIAKASHGQFRVDPDGVHLVVGGIGGFGLATAEWLVEKGARTIALCSRRGVADAETQAMIDTWNRLGVTTVIDAVDVTVEAEVAALLTRLRAIGPLKTIIHAAMVLDDALLRNLTRERNRAVIAVKASGATWLDQLTRDDDLDNFILFSSATTLIGNPGQANYVAANGYLEGLARARRAEGLPALAIGFGAIADRGYLAANAQVGDVLAKKIGKLALTARTALNMVEATMRATSHDVEERRDVEEGVVMISELDWNAARALSVVGSPLFEVMLRGARDVAGVDGAIDVAAMIAGKSQQEAETVLFNLVAGEIAGILRVSRESITPAKVLKDIGLDSLMAVELNMNFQKTTGIELPLSGIGDSTTVTDLVRKLYDRVASRDGEEDAPVRDEDRLIQDMARQHVDTDVRQVGAA